ncbi:MAG: S8 family serine peptidase, partial [Gemmatimonadota bacterium]|nr:S8 family serine peptidase [Gemmatimonadota bacterium]
MFHRPLLPLAALLAAAFGCAGGTTAVPATASPAVASADSSAGGGAAPAPLVPPLEAYLRGWMPLRVTRIDAFLQDHPEYDGRGTLIAILDSGIDPGVPGLGTTTTGERKILDLRDFSGEGRVALAPVSLKGETVRAGGQVLTGLTRLRALMVGTTGYAGGIAERPLGMMPASDLNGDGDDRDTLAVVAARLTDGWAVFADTDGDGSLADESPVRDYLSGRETFGWRRGTAPSPITVAVNLRDSASAPLLDLVFDNSAHGTHVAGIAAGSDLYDVAGFDGVAPGAFLLGIKIANNAHGGISTTGAMADAIGYAIRFARERRLPLVINLSFGVGNEAEGQARIDHLVDSVLAAEPSVVFVTSAGNDGPGLSTMGFPGSAPRAITVGATFPLAFLGAAGDSAGPIAYFSSRGGELAKPELAAPGMAYSSVPRWNTGDEVKQGTSMAAPHVSGLAALLLSGLKAENRIADARTIRQALMVTAPPLVTGTYLDGGTGVPDLPAAWRWLAQPRDLPDVTVRALRGGVTAGWGVEARPGAGDTAAFFEITLPSGSPAKDFRLRSSAAWLAPPLSIKLESGPNRVALTLAKDASLGAGVHFGTVSGWTADSLAGPAFRLVATVIVPDEPVDSTVDLGPLAPGTEVRRFFPADSARPFQVGVAATVAGEQALVFLHEPGGAPYREVHGAAAGHGPDAAVFQVDGRDAAQGLYEVVVVAHPQQPASAALTVTRSPVGIGATREGDSLVVRLHNYSAAAQTVETAAGLVGVERQVTLAGSGSAPQRVSLTIPEWAERLAVDVRLDPALWPALTDFGVTLVDASGRQIDQEPLHYALGRLTIDLDSTHAGGAELLLLPGFADRGEKPWSASVSLRFYGGEPEVVQHASPVTIEPGATGRVTLPWQDSPFRAGEAFFPLGIVAVTVNQRL